MKNKKYSIRLTEEQWREIWQCIEAGFFDHMDFHDICSPSDADREKNMDFLQKAKDELADQLHNKLNN